MSTVKSQLRYSAEHEWVSDESPAAVGITMVATDALGDVVFLDLPEVGTRLIAGEVCGEVESTKSVSDIYAPVTGTVVARNEAALADPAVLNTDPYGEGWLLRIEVEEEGPLLTAEEYAAANDAELS